MNTKKVNCRAWDGGFIEMPATQLRFRVSAYGIILQDNKLLLMRQGDHRGYSFPGGGIEDDEFIEGGLIREIVEETGLMATVQEKLYFEEDMFYYNPLDQAIHGVMLFYKCKVNGCELKINNTEVEEEVPKWVEIKELSADLFWGVNGKIFDQLKKDGYLK